MILTPHKSLAGLPTQALSAPCPSSQKCKVIRRIQLLQKVANKYDLEPEERFGAWFQAMEPLSVEER